MSLQWSLFLKSYCCGCFMNDNVEEVSDKQSANDNGIKNDNGISETILVLESKNDLSESMLLDLYEEFITITETDVKNAKEMEAKEMDSISSEAKEFGSIAKEMGSIAKEMESMANEMESMANEMESMANEAKSPGNVPESPNADEAEESITKIEDKIIPEPNDNYF